uniref:ras and Rab interactor 2-like n=1 Tax=Myxine glutinosa TaxID=7769 RepID=UPI00358F3069
MQPELQDIFDAINVGLIAAFHICSHHLHPQLNLRFAESYPTSLIRMENVMQNEENAATKMRNSREEQPEHHGKWGGYPVCFWNPLYYEVNGLPMPTKAKQLITGIPLPSPPRNVPHHHTPSIEWDNNQKVDQQWLPCEDTRRDERKSFLSIQWPLTRCYSDEALTSLKKVFSHKEFSSQTLHSGGGSDSALHVQMGTASQDLEKQLYSTFAHKPKSMTQSEVSLVGDEEDLPFLGNKGQPVPCISSPQISSEDDEEVAESNRNSSHETNLSKASPNDEIQIQHRRHRLSEMADGAMSNKVLGTMRGVFSAFQTRQKRLYQKIIVLAHDKRSTFGKSVHKFVATMQEPPDGNSITVMLKSVFSFLNDWKTGLMSSGELEPSLFTSLDHEAIDTAIEKALHEVVLKPLAPFLRMRIVAAHKQDGRNAKLCQGLAEARKQARQQVRHGRLNLPGPTTVQRVRTCFRALQRAYSPRKKIVFLLQACKIVYQALGSGGKEELGADELLPFLLYTVAFCDMPSLDPEVEYIMELLDPSLLTGEGGYYLTTLYGVLYMLRSSEFMEQTKKLSSGARRKLHQWHRRRSTTGSRSSQD